MIQTDHSVFVNVKRFLKIGLTAGILIMSSNSVKAQCELWGPGGSMVDIQYPNGYCANANAQGVQVDISLMSFRISQSVNLSNLSFYVDWGNGTQTIPANDSRIKRTTSGTDYLYNSDYFTHYYPQTPNCVYNLSVVPVINGTRCQVRRTENITIWGTDAMMGAELVFVDADNKNIHYVCEGKEINVTFFDRSILNCNWLTGSEPNTAEYEMNDRLRHTRFTYGVTGNSAVPGGGWPVDATPAYQIPSLSVYGTDGGVPAGPTSVTGNTGPIRPSTTKNSGNFLAGMPLVGNLIRTENPGPSMNIPTGRIYVPSGQTTEGQVFTVQLDNWNACNPYYPNNGTSGTYTGNAPVTTYAYIIVTKAPPPIIAQDNIYCHEDHYTAAQRNTLYQVTAKHDESIKALSGFTPGVYKWYDEDGTLLKTSTSYTDNTFNPVNYGSTGKRLKTGTPGVYKYTVTYQWNPPNPSSSVLPCETDPVEFTWTVRESIKAAPGQPNGNTTGCSGATINLYYGANNNTVPPSYTWGGATKYVWRIINAGGTGTNAATLTDTYSDGRSVQVVLNPDPTAAASNSTITVTLGVHREWQTATSWTNTATGVIPASSDACPSTEETITITVNPLPTARLNSGAEYCATETPTLTISNLAGANTTSPANFDIYMNYSGSTPITYTSSAAGTVTFTPTGTAQVNPGQFADYYIYKVVDKNTKCESVAATAAPFTTTKLSTQSTPVRNIRRPTLTAPTINYPTNSTLLCANTNFPVTVSPASAASETITGKNVSVAPAANTTVAANLTRNTTYDWEWLPSTTATSGNKQTIASAPSPDFNSGDAASPGGTQKKLTLQRRYVDNATSGSNCPVEATPVTPTVIPNPTARITTTPDIIICENSATSVDIEVKGYSTGTWNVAWTLTKAGGFTASGTTPNIANPTGASAGTGTYTLSLPATQFDTYPSAHGEYTLTLTSVVQNTSANCTGTVIPAASIKITVVQAPSVTLTGTGPVCESRPYTIPASNITFPTGATGVPYDIKYTSSYTGATQHSISLNPGQDLVIPWAHIAPPPATTTITFVSIEQGGCPGTVHATNRTHTITVIPTPAQAKINTLPQSICGNSLTVNADAVTATDYTGSWEVKSSPSAGTSGSFVDSLSNSTTFNIGTNGAIHNFGEYELVWKIEYTGSAPITCPPTRDSVLLMFGTDAQPPSVNVPSQQCGNRVQLIANNTLYAWEEQAASTGWTVPTEYIGVADIELDPTDKRRAIGILTSGLDGTARFRFTIGTSPGCEADTVSRRVQFVGIPDLNVPVGNDLGLVCPFDAVNNSIANQIDYTLSDNKALSNTQFEWYLSPDPSLSVPGWSTTSPTTGAQVAFNAPANNNTWEITYNILQKAFRTVSGLYCETPQVAVKLIVKPKPKLKPIANQNLCPGEKVPTLALDPGPGLLGHPVIYNWMNNGPNATSGLLTNTSINVSVSPFEHTLTAGTTTTVDGGGYLVAETNNIKLQAEVRDCKSDTIQFTITVNPEPVISTQNLPATYCPGQELSLTTTPATPSFTSNVQNADYQWVYTGDLVGLPFGTQSNSDNLGYFKTNPNPSTDGSSMTGTVSMTVTGKVISSISGKGCIATGSFPVTVKPQPVMRSMNPESVCASVDEASAVRFPTNISFGISNIPAGVTNVEYKWYNRGDAGIAGKDYNGPLVTFNGITTTQSLSGVSGTGISNIPVPLSGDGADRIAIIWVYPTMDGCIGDSVKVERTAYALPKLAYIPNDTVCAGEYFKAVNFTPDLSINRIQWTSNTDVGFGTSGTTNISASNRAIPNITGNIIDATITAYAVKNYGTLQCKGPDSTFHKVVRPSPVLVITPSSSQTSICPGGSFPSLTFSSPTTAAVFQSKIEYSWSISDNSIGVGMPSGDTGDNMISYIGSNNIGGTTLDGTVTLEASLNGCPSSNKPTITLYLKPKPVMDHINNMEFCPDITVNRTVLASNVVGKENTGTEWSLGGTDGTGISQFYPPTPLTQLSSSGLGNIPSFRTANHSGSPTNLEGIFTIWATVDNCTSDTKTFTVEIKPTPDILGTTDLFLCHGDILPQAITFSSLGFPDATFEWRRFGDPVGYRYPLPNLPDPPVPLPTSGTGSIPRFQADNASTGQSSEVAATFIVQSKTTGGCFSPADTFSITVGAVPQLGFTNLTVCASDEIKVANFSTIVNPSVIYTSADTVYNWKVKDVRQTPPLPHNPGWFPELGIQPVNVDQTGSIIAFFPDTAYFFGNTLWGTQANEITIEAYVTLKHSDITGLGCPSKREDMKITINPLPITKFDPNTNDCVGDGTRTLYQTFDGADFSTYVWGLRSDPDDNPTPGGNWEYAPSIPNPNNYPYEVYEYPKSGEWTGYIIVQETNRFGCVGPNKELFVKTVPTPVVVLGSDMYVCSGTPVQLSASVNGITDTSLLPPTIELDWFPQPDPGEAGKLDPLKTFYAIGNTPSVFPQSLWARNGNCRSNVVSMNITVYPLPEEPKLMSQSYCTDEPAWNMTALSMSTNFRWYRMDGSDTIRIGNNTTSSSATIDMKDVGTHTYSLPWFPIVRDTTFMYGVSQISSYSYTPAGGSPTQLYCASSLGTAPLNIRLSPIAPTPRPETYCEGDNNRTYRLFADFNPTGNTTNLFWYNTPTGGSPYGNWYYDVSPTGAGSSPTYELATYYVSAYAANGCESARISIPLTVYPNPSLDFEITDGINVVTGGCSPFEIHVRNNSVAGTTADYRWAWAPGDTTAFVPFVTSNNFTHTYQVAGTVPESAWVKLIGLSNIHFNSVTGKYCRSEMQQVLTIGPGVIADFDVSPSEGCSPLSTYFYSKAHNAYNARWYWNTATPPPFTTNAPVLPSNDPSQQYWGEIGHNPYPVFVNTTGAPQDFHVWFQVDNNLCYAEKDTIITVFPTPVASFVHNLTNGENCPPEPVIFTNTSTSNPPKTKYEWNMGDGLPRPQDFIGNYTHTFESLNALSSMNYTIILTAFIDTVSIYTGLRYTCRSSYHQSITVHPQVQADFTGDTEGCSPMNARFQSQSLGAISNFSWNWGDPNDPMPGGGPSPVHRYVNPTHNAERLYKVTLTVSNKDCKSEITKDFNLFPQPMASFYMVDYMGCQPLTVTFNNTSNTAGATPNHISTVYNWDYNDGDTEFQPVGSHTHKFTNVLGNNLTLRPILTAENQWGCTNSMTDVVTVFPYIKADFVLEDSVDCSPYTIRIRNASQGYDTGEFDFGNGQTQSITRSSGTQFMHLYDNLSMYEDAVYKLSLIVFAGGGTGCSDTVVKKVTALAKPTADFRPGSPYPADFPYPAPPILLDNLIPSPHKEHLRYLWSYTEQGSTYMNNFDTKITPSPLGFSEWGTYNITQRVTAPNNICSDSKTLTINIVPPQSIADFEDVDPDCMPYEVTFINKSRYAKAYKWDFGDGYTSNAENPTHVYADAGEYWVTLTATGDNLFPSTKTKKVVVHPLPQASFSVGQNFLWVGQALRPANYTSHQYSNGQPYDVWYRWDWGDNTPKDTVESPSHMYLKSGEYTITLTTGTYTHPQCISVKTIPSAVELENSGDIILPNTFRPNPDGEPSDVIPDRGYKNYLFYPPVATPVSKYRFMIYNRWGQLLYETTDPNRGWSGYFRGRLCDEDVYVYVIEGVFVTGQSFKKTGDILLLR